MVRNKLRSFGLLVVFLVALIEAGYAEITDTLLDEEDKGADRGPILPGKEAEVDRILSKPPRSFMELLGAVPFSIYGKDKHGNYVAFCLVSA